MSQVSPAPSLPLVLMLVLSVKKFEYPSTISQGLPSLMARFKCPVVFEAALGPTCQAPYFTFATLVSQPTGWEF